MHSVWMEFTEIFKFQVTKYWNTTTITVLTAVLSDKKPQSYDQVCKCKMFSQQTIE